MSQFLFDQGDLDFAELIIRSLDGTITAEQFDQLDHEIIANNEARAYYLEFITTYVGLVDLAGVLPKADIEKLEIPQKTLKAALDFDPDISEEDKIRVIEHYADKQLKAFLAQEHRNLREPQCRDIGWDLSETIDHVTETAEWLFKKGIKVAKTTAVCSLVAAVILIFVLYVYANRTVATLVNSVNAKWNIEVGKDSRIRPMSIRLEEGYARIALKKGAEVILQAPTTFKVQTRNRMFLENGWITAKVPPQAIGFEIKTPASSVVDYGTEFGLLVGAGSSAELHVFEGRIGLTSGDYKSSAKYQQRLEKGEAAVVDANGRFDRGVLLDRPSLFVRTMPVGSSFGIPGVRLDLADMVGGGNGLGTAAPAQGIDPSTGEIIQGHKVLHAFDKGFAKVPSLPFIDGVFIPDSNDGSAVITSTGLVFKECPKTKGSCFQTIINGAMFRAGSLDLHFGRLASQTYGTKEHPSIGMHPNSGITFDLAKIRSSMPDVEISRFRALCGVSETAVEYALRDSDPNLINVDFWVLVDGRIRFTKKLLAVPAQSERIDIPLGPHDRFLSLVATNPGNYLYCWSMFTEPMLELMKK